MLPLADLLGHQGVAAAAEHHAQGGDEEDHGHGDVDGGQAVGIHPPCHKDAVYGGVDVHDDVGDDGGQGKAEEPSGGDRVFQFQRLVHLVAPFNAWLQQAT